MKNRNIMGVSLTLFISVVIIRIFPLQDILSGIAILIRFVCHV